MMQFMGILQLIVVGNFSGPLEKSERAALGQVCSKDKSVKVMLASTMTELKGYSCKIT